MKGLKKQRRIQIIVLAVVAMVASFAAFYIVARMRCYFVPDRGDREPARPGRGPSASAALSRKEASCAGRGRRSPFA